LKKVTRKNKQRLLKLDLGCGQNKRHGFIGIDISNIPGVDIRFDLSKAPWPLPSASVDEVFSSHFFEHLTGPERMRFMDEMYRVMIPGGKALIIVPDYASERAVQDPTHAWPPVCKASFLYFNKNWRTQNRLDHYPIECDFDFSYGYILPQEWAKRSSKDQMFAITHYLNVVYDLQINLIRR